MVQRFGISGVVALLLLLVSGTQGILRADVKVSPHYIFVSATTNKLISLSVSNDGTDDREVWVDSRYGYETSDDSGKVYIKLDTIAIDEPTAAAWIKCYPRRFILRAGEGQTVRFIVTPPPGLPVGEYWARIYVSSKSRQTPKSGSPVTVVKPGISLLMEQSIPFHFRVGTVTTGIRVDSLATAFSDTGLTICTKLFRTGNAAFWGSRTFTLTDRSGKNWLTWSHNTGVYKSLKIYDTFNRTSFPPGEYTLTARYHSDGRGDIPPHDVLRCIPVELSIPVRIP